MAPANAGRIERGTERRHAGSLLWITHTADESRRSQNAAGTSKSKCHPPSVDSPVRRRYRACEEHRIQAGDRIPDRAQRSDTLWPEARRLAIPNRHAPCDTMFAMATFSRRHVLAALTAAPALILARKSAAQDSHPEIAKGPFDGYSES